jgi:hypothetical protein
VDSKKTGAAVAVNAGQHAAGVVHGQTRRIDVIA